MLNFKQNRNQNLRVIAFIRLISEPVDSIWQHKVGSIV